MNFIETNNQTTAWQDTITSLSLANSAIIDSEEAAEENYQRALAQADKWQEKFENALQIRYIKLAHEALLHRNYYKEQARKLEAFMDEQFAKRIENLAIIDEINKLLAMTFDEGVSSQEPEFLLKPVLFRADDYQVQTLPSGCSPAKKLA